MVEQILPWFETIFSKCAEWTGVLLDAVGGKNVLLAAFCIVLVITLLFMPLRGIGLNMSFDDFGGYVRNVTHSPKRLNGRNQKKLSSGSSQKLLKE